jgi:hypothetical protein
MKQQLSLEWLEGQKSFKHLIMLSRTHPHSIISISTHTHRFTSMTVINSLKTKSIDKGAQPRRSNYFRRELKTEQNRESSETERSALWLAVSSLRAFRAPREAIQRNILITQ